MPKAKILIADSDITWTLRLSDAMIQDNYETFSANATQDTLLLLDARNIDVLIVDVNGMPGVEGATFLEQLRQVYPATMLIVHTARVSIQQAVLATRLGACDYVEKSNQPQAIIALRQKVARAVQERGTMVNIPNSGSDNRVSALSPVQGFHGIISQNSRMRDIFELIQTIADSYANVLIQGETGTGKELVARAVHEASGRRGKPFITLDCSALARELLESELFGHEKGAFTGAVDRHTGRFERANGGTLFLDEVSNINLAIQAKLLRVLQTRTFERVGGQKSISVDVRIVAATNKPLEPCVADATFREDLYHRLNVVQIELPALRERAEDIPLLAMEFLRRFGKQYAKDVRAFSDAALRMLSNYHWPGNVRELENVVLQAVVLAKSSLIDVSDLPKRILHAPAVAAAPSSALADQLGEPEKQILLDALHKNSGNIKRTADTLQISRTTLYAKLKKYQIDPDAIR